MKTIPSLKKISQDPGCLNEYDPNSMNFEDVHPFLLKFVKPINKTETISLEDAHKRVLAKAIKSPVNVPNYDNSAMDGYAIRFKQKILTFQVTGSILAGSLKPKKLKSGEAMQIMTGGKIPQGCDAVIPIELVEENDQFIQMKALPKKNANIRFVGEDVKKGQTILKQGDFLRPAEIGLLASLGLAKVNVYKKLKVGFFSSGDEVIEVGKQLKTGQVYDSNRYAIGALLKNFNLDIVHYKNVSDNKADIKKTLLRASKNCNLIISTGGVSVGKADYMKEVLKELGQILFWKLAIKPGRPLAYGQISKAHFFGLPGNPVSALVTFYQIVQPAIRVLMGDQDYSQPPLFKVRALEPIFKKPGRVEFQRGVLSKIKNEWFVKPTPHQGSAILSSMTQANCFIVLEKNEASLKKNDWVNVQLMSDFI
jgi:molybdopterin molybdotransferase